MPTYEYRVMKGNKIIERYYSEWEVPCYYRKGYKIKKYNLIHQRYED